MNLETKHLVLMNAVVARTTLSTMHDAREFSKTDSTLKALREAGHAIDIYDVGRHRFAKFYFGDQAIEVHVGPKPDRPKIGAPDAGPESPDPGTPGTTIPTALAA
jgi:hypothetical protein